MKTYWLDMPARVVLRRGGDVRQTARMLRRLLLLPLAVAAAALAGPPVALAVSTPADPGRLHTADVDGDGLADVVVPDAADGSALLSGVPGVTVVFGARDRAAVVTRGAVPSARSMRIVLTGRRLGNPAIVGDVNGDGLADVGVGVAQRSGTETGAYLVLGSSTARGATIDLAAPPAGRVVALPKAAGPFFGGPPVLGLGDVDGDGLDDVGTATRRRGAQGGVVVLGRRAWPARVNLDRLGRRGITILTGQGSPATPWPVGDVDADGLADMAFVTDDPRRVSIDYAASMAWVVYGRAGGATVRFTNTRRSVRPSVRVRGRAAGFAFRPDIPCGCTFESIGQAGDVNGDGRADVLVPERSQEVNTVDLLDVVFGQRRSRVQVGIGAGLRGLRIPGAAASRGATSIGDLTGDGYSDVLAPAATGGGLAVAPGRRLGVVTPVFQPWVATGTSKVSSASPAGDVDGDGRGDLLLLLDGSTRAAVVYGQAALAAVDLAAPAGRATPIG